MIISAILTLTLSARTNNIQQVCTLIARTYYIHLVHTLSARSYKHTICFFKESKGGGGPVGDKKGRLCRVQMNFEHMHWVLPFGNERGSIQVL